MVAEQAQTIQRLQLTIIELRKYIFGSGQEKFKANVGYNPMQGDLFPGEKIAEVVTESVKKVPAYEVKKTVVRVNHPGRTPLPEHLRREVIVLTPDEDVSGLQPVGEQITEILEYKQGELFVKKYVRPEYIKNADDNLSAKRIIAAVPDMPLQKSYVGSSLLAHLMVNKYVDHLPIHRSLQIFQRSKVTLPSNTVSNWITGGVNLIEPLYNAFEQLVLQTKYLAVDETTIQVLDKTKKGKTHTGYYWVYYDTVNRMALFKYHPGRGGEWPKETLKNYTGYLQTDGYGGYDQFGKVEGITWLNCWAHARRKFIDAQRFDNDKASTVLVLIQKLYDIERDMRKQQAMPEEIQAYRQDHATPVLAALHKVITTQLANTPPSTPLGQALQYSLTRWDRLNVYITDGNLQIDTNLVENSIRPIAIGRKNYLFAGNHDAAQRSAMLYSLFATCKLHEVNPVEWLTYVFENINEHKINNIEALLPQNYKALVNG